MNKRKKFFITALFLSLVIGVLSMNNSAFASKRDYSYLYQSPPKQALGACGVYAGISSRVVYAPSPSKLKNKRHAQRTAAYNRMASYYYY